jgi:thiamine biosynthesis lipoprotein
MPAVERARPLLGTVVSIRVEDCRSPAAHCAIDAAFAEVALIQRLMSFQDPDSELSGLNRAAASRAVSVHRHTFAVLRWSRAIAQASGGSFDVSAAQRPRGALADWRDIELLPMRSVRFRRPLRIDLGGIAKGYAVDLAVTRLRALGVRRALVNAGGDLRVLGPDAERIALRSQGQTARLAVIELANGALATSGAAAGTTVSVLARRCVVADALTKVVMADERAAAAVLRLFGARALRHQSAGNWRELQ